MMVDSATYRSALKALVWLNAMKEELDALHHQHTWSLVLLPPNKNLVGCKWVFKLKTNSDGSIARHKASLVAKGFNQEPGLDYGETFSPMVKPTTVRLVLALAAHFNWPLRQLDVKNAFLYRVLNEESTYSDSSLFVKIGGSDIVIVLLYVDDIIISGSSTFAIQQVIQSLTTEFDIKDLGELHYFLGIQITKTDQGLFLSQSKYIQDLLKNVEMMDCKACDTPCLPYNRLLKDDVSHFTTVKRILRYLKGTLLVGLSYTRGALSLKAFSDADWAGDPNDRRSTTGMVVFLGNNPISWSSKKQNTVSRSSTEAEYRAMSTTSAEIDWIQQLLQFMHVKLCDAPVLFCDNLFAIALSFNPVQHQWTKHIEIDVHFVRE
ncbi:unnamed protein product [Malus baccata var. baccata]